MRRSTVEVYAVEHDHRTVRPSPFYCSRISRQAGIGCCNLTLLLSYGCSLVRPCQRSESETECNRSSAWNDRNKKKNVPRNYIPLHNCSIVSQITCDIKSHFQLFTYLIPIWRAMSPHDNTRCCGGRLLYGNNHFTLINNIKEILAGDLESSSYLGRLFLRRI